VGIERALDPVLIGRRGTPMIADETKLFPVYRRLSAFLGG
jgi:hypothetical protein